MKIHNQEFTIREFITVITVCAIILWVSMFIMAVALSLSMDREPKVDYDKIKQNQYEIVLKELEREGKTVNIFISHPSFDDYN